GKFVEVQGTAEGEPFDNEQLDGWLRLAEKGIGEIIGLQSSTLAEKLD
ncbi:MAG TPA: ribonuclease PH, partial [Acidimicrobiaceae bacterium]|nr:ribonuclease PH [Acidimicrobiaceae bacterium]